jgi:uncharacterized protein DUF3106
MPCPRSIPLLAALSFGLMFGPGALAQSRRGGAAKAPHAPREETDKGAKTPIDEFETMPPAEREKALNRLPAAQRQKVQEQLQRFNQLPAQQQQALKNLYNRLHQLPPQRQEAVRKAINKLSEQPAERQQVLREGLRNLAALPQQERQARMASPDFRSTFSKKEQDILRDMSPLLPER